MKITLIGNGSSVSSKRLAQEAQELNVDFEVVSLESLVLSVQDDAFSLTNEHGEDVAHSDCYIFRGVGHAAQEVMTIAKYLIQHGATVIEEKCAFGAIMMDKLFLQATDNHVPTLDYAMVQGKEALLSAAASLEYPVVMKATVGSMGKNVSLAKSQRQLLKLFKKLGPRVILQHYVPADHDVRAIVIGGKYVGAYRRTRDDGEFRMNRPGNKKEPINLPAAAIQLCEIAATSQNIEVAGVDMLEYNNKWYVLEINMSPQFSKFEECTGINVAKQIIEYAIEKTQSQ